MVKKIKYDLILMNMQMSVMGGLEATKIIRRLDGYSNLPIIYTTANVMDSDRELCRKLRSI